MAKRSSKSTKRKKRVNEEPQSLVRYQKTSLLLFVCAVLSFCLLLIKGERLWRGLHDILFGTFGWCAWLVPLLLVYFSVLLALENSKAKIRSAVIQCVVLLFLSSGTVQIFMQKATAGYVNSIIKAYSAKQAGAVGAVFGYPLEYFLSDIGAKIVVLLLVFVFVMLLFAVSMGTFYRAIYKPFQKTKETVSPNVKQQKENKKEHKEKRKKIDIQLDGEAYLPESETESSVIPTPVYVQDEEEIPSVSAEKFNILTKAAQELYQDTEPSSIAVDDLLEKQKIPSEPETVAFVEDEPTEKAIAVQQEVQKPAPMYRFPPVSLLNRGDKKDDNKAETEMQNNAELLVKTLKDFGISTRVLNVSRGPSVTRYELEPSAGVKVSRITGLADDLALRLATTGVRIEAPIPNKAAVGIEVPNKVGQSVTLREMFESREFSSAKSRLTVALGRDIAGNAVFADLGKMPHLLIAGTTGSGKSVCTNAMIQSLLYRNAPEDVRLLLIDPKQVEFGVYNGIPHLLVPVVTEPRKAAGALGWAVTEMLNRYKTFAENNVRDISAYNELATTDDTLQKLPLIVIVIDELADLMMAASNEVEDAIIRLAQMARAAGMHLVIATQRPSVDVITGLIKANIPSRLALTVASGTDSRTILDSVGAEKLLGRGDMLFMPIGMSKPMRVQGCFVSEKEVKAVVDFLKSNSDPNVGYDEKIAQDIELKAAASGKNTASKVTSEDGEGGGEAFDEMLPQAIEVVVEAGMASTSLLQRKLRLGYARAGRIIDELENRGIVGPHEGSKPRAVLITRQQWLEMNMRTEE